MGQAWLDKSVMPLALPSKLLEFYLVQVGEGMQRMAFVRKYDNKTTGICARREWCKQTHGGDRRSSTNSFPSDQHSRESKGNCMYGLEKEPSSNPPDVQAPHWKAWVPVVRHNWPVGAELWLSHCSPTNLLFPLCLPRGCSAHPLVQAWDLTGTVALGSLVLASVSCLLAVPWEVTSALNGKMCWVETGCGLRSAGNNINRLFQQE